MAFDWILTDSEAVERFGYAPRTRELHVVFTGGRHYVYRGVPEALFKGLIEAESIGQFLNARIKPYFSVHGAKPLSSGPKHRFRASGHADRRPDRERQVRPGAKAGQ